MENKDIAYDTVQKDFERGTSVEEWIEKSLRTHFQNQGVVVKLTDRGSRAHKYVEIKDVPSEPDLKIYCNLCRDLAYPAEVWVTHKLVKNPHSWGNVRKRWIKEMFWKLKTFLSAKENHWMMYAIYQDNYPETYEPIELILCFVGNQKEKRKNGKWEGWTPECGGVVYKFNMEDCIILFSKGNWTFDNLCEAFKAAFINAKKMGYQQD